MKKLVFATNNPHKLGEIRELLAHRIEVLSLSDIGCQADIPETADTLEGNALLKARYVYDRYGLPCFADDTGLMVDALAGAPGVYSARYAGPDCSPEDNMHKLLGELEGVSVPRVARFRTIIALIDEVGEHLFEGVVEGQISLAPRGEGGFGYDPIFIPNSYAETFAELGEGIKNKISHRAKAVEGIVAYLSRTNY